MSYKATQCAGCISANSRLVAADGVVTVHRVATVDGVVAVDGVVTVDRVVTLDRVDRADRVVTVDGVERIVTVDRVVAVDENMVFSTQQCKVGYCKLTVRTCTSATFRYGSFHWNTSCF